MYSDEDDEFDIYCGVRQTPAAAVDAEKGKADTSVAATPPVAAHTAAATDTATIEEENGGHDEQLERYFERCVILVDLMPLLPDGKYRDRTSGMVEGYFAVLHFPLLQDYAGVSFERHLFYTPTLSCGGMKRNERKDLLLRVKNAIRFTHDIPPLFKGCSVEEQTAQYGASKRSLEEACGAAGAGRLEHNVGVYNQHNANVEQQAAMPRQLAREVGRVVREALQAYRAEGWPDRLAFFTTRERRDCVERVLQWMAKELSVIFPPYIVYTPEDVMNEYWCGLMSRVVERGKARCVVHSRPSGEGKSYECCKTTVVLLRWLLSHAADHLARMRDTAVTAQPALPIATQGPIYVEEDDEEGDDDM